MSTYALYISAHFNLFDFFDTSAKYLQMKIYNDVDVDVDANDMVIIPLLLPPLSSPSIASLTKQR